MTVNPYGSANTYKSMEVTSVNRLKLIVMVYDAAIASLKQARASHERNDNTKRNQFISRAQFIVHELNNALDINSGKQIATSLRDIYHFLNRHLNEALSHNTIKNVEESLKILSNLREAWHEISLNAIKEPAAPDSAAVFHKKESLNCG